MLKGFQDVYLEKAEMHLGQCCDQSWIFREAYSPLTAHVQVMGIIHTKKVVGEGLDIFPLTSRVVRK